MELDALRSQIDDIDAEIIRLFSRRMEVVRGVAEWKRKNGAPVLQTGREQDVLNRAAAVAGPELAQSARFLSSVLMDLSKAQQNTQLAGESPLQRALAEALQNGGALPTAPTVACQGVDGAYSSLAARAMFPAGRRSYCATWDEVFRSVKDGVCDIGVLPIENSTAGSVNTVYDLMKKHRVYIVRGHRLCVEHCLLAKPGEHLSDITDIYSHEQAISQCSEFLQAHPNIRVHLYSNTAAAARFVGECGDRGVAAIASRECAEIYRLSVVLDEIKNAEQNYTRFIAISNKMILTPDADKMSIALTLPHESGSLYRLISQFAMLGLNLLKLESRPLPDTNFEFLFYFDFAGSAAVPDIRALLCRLEQQCETFEFLGNYREGSDADAARM